jgi:uncharacterized membrane protein (DUF485 family)
MTAKDYPVNYFKEAFQTPINLVLLTLFFFLFVASFLINYFATDWIGFRIPSETILAFSVAIELFLLGLMAQNPQFQKNINQKYLAQRNILQQELETAQIISKLSKESLKKFIKFYQRKDQLLQKSIDAGASTDGILIIIKENTDKLAKSYAQHLLMSELYHKQLAQSDTQKLTRELNDLLSEIQNADGKKKALLQQRADLLKKRIDKLTTLKEELAVADLQIKTIEDTLEYLHENALSKSNINEFVNTIDEIYTETETYQNALREIQEIF